MAEVIRFDALPSLPDEDVASLRKVVMRRALLVRERSKMKIRGYLTYNGLEEPAIGLFTEKGIDWLRSLKIEPIDMYLAY